MVNLVAVLEQLQGKLERFRREGLKETPTRTIFVDPLLGALGWDVRDPDEVQLEYPTIDGKSVDYALKINRKPVLLLEAKALNDPLTDVKDVTQTTGYAANNGIVWCILTNGVRWRVYRSIEQCPAPEKLMYEVSYDPADLKGVPLTQIVDNFKRFSREHMAKGELDALGEQTFTDGKIRKAMSQLVTDPPSALLKLVRRATGDKTLRPQVIKESLGRILSPLLSGSAPARATTEPARESIRKLAAEKSWKTRRDRAQSPYTEEWHTKDKPREAVELYQKIDEFCLGLRPGQISKSYLAKYISWRDGKRTFCSLHILRGSLRVWLDLKYQRLQNPPAYVRDMSGVGHWGIGDVELAITSANQLPEAERLIRRSLAGE